MIRVTVNRDGIDKGVANPIRLENVATGRSIECSGADLSNATIRFCPNHPLADGTRVWIECDEATPHA